MSSSFDAVDSRLGRILDEVLKQIRAGENPALDSYLQDCPELEAPLREALSAMLLIEGIPIDKTEQLNRTQPALEPKLAAAGSLQQLGEYEILSEIGRGGMGIVYRARQKSLDRIVALKVLPGWAKLNPQYGQRFEREAQAAGALQHEHVVPVYAVGREQDLQFYVMQFIEGLSLDRVLDQLRDSCSTNDSRPASGSRQPQDTSRQMAAGTSGRDCPGSQPEGMNRPNHQPGDFGDHWNSTNHPMFFRNAAKLGADVASALAYAHDHGILHRDIKPSNLLLDRNGKIWVVDFGLAKFGDEPLTATADILGTLKYMPPERLRGWSDNRSDIYSLGLTLYEIITLQPAFHGKERVELLRRIEHEDPIPPRRIAPRIPAELETIILKSISKEPGLRYRKAIELAEDLNRFREGRPIKARRISRTRQFQMWCRRQPAIAGLTAFVILLLITISVASIFFALRMNDRNLDLAEANQLADERLYSAYVAQAETSRSSSEPGRRYKGLASLNRAAGLLEPFEDRDQRRLELRNRAIALSSLMDVAPDRYWPGPGYAAALFRHGFNQSVDSMVRVQDKNIVQIMNLETGQCEQEFILEDKNLYAAQACLSPDGRQLGIRLTLRSGRMRNRIIDRNSGKIIFETKPFYSNTYVTEFSPDGQRFACCLQNNMLGIIHLATAEVLQSIPVSNLHNCQFSKDGQLLILNLGDSFEIRKVNSGQLLSKNTFQGIAKHVSFGHHSGQVIGGFRDGSLRIWKWASGNWKEATTEYQRDLDPLEYCSVHPDRPLALAVSRSGRSAIFDSNSGRKQFEFNHGVFRVGRRGRLLGISDSLRGFGRLRLLQSEECRRLSVPQTLEGFSTLSFSPDEKWLIGTNRAYFDTALWEVATGHLQLNLENEKYVGSAVFHPALKNGHYRLAALSLGQQPLAKYRLSFTKQNSWTPPLATLKPEESKSKLNNIFYTDFDAQGKVFLTDENGQLELRSWDDAGVLCRFDIQHEVHYASVSPDAKWISATSRNFPFVCVYDADNGDLAFELVLPEEQYRSQSINTGALASFSRDGKLLGISLPDEFRVYATANWKLLKSWKRTRPGLGYMSFSANYIATADTDAINLYSRDEFQIVARLQTAEQHRVSNSTTDMIPMMLFSPSGRYLAASTTENQVLLWDLPRLRETLQGLGLNW